MTPFDPVTQLADAPDPHDVCGYPDGKVFVRGLGGEGLGRIDKREYMEGEPAPPRILGMKPA